MIVFNSRGIFHGRALRTLHRNPNLGMLTMPATTNTRQSKAFNQLQESNLRPCASTTHLSILVDQLRLLDGLKRKRKKNENIKNWFLYGRMIYLKVDFYIRMREIDYVELPNYQMFKLLKIWSTIYIKLKFWTLAFWSPHIFPTI